LLPERIAWSWKGQQMDKWQISLRDFLAVVTLVAIAICAARVVGAAIFLGFLPGSYLAAVPFRRDARRSWDDLLSRVAACALGGSLSSPIITIGTGWALGLMVVTVETSPPTHEPLPAWLWLLFLFEFLIAGSVLGAVYGAIETAILWGPRDSQ